jgi:hypothetical protein
MRQNPLLPDKTTCLFVGLAIGIFSGNQQFSFQFNAAVFMLYAPRFIRRRAFCSDQLLATGLGFYTGQAGMFFLRPVAQSVVSFINESILGYT